MLGARRSRAPEVTSTPASPVHGSPAPRTLTLRLPPGLTVCSGWPRSGWGPQSEMRCLALLGPEPASTIFHRERPAAMGAASLANAPSILAFPCFCEDYLTCAARLCVSGAQSLEKAGGARWSFLP